MTTQNARLLAYLKSHKRGITQLEAFNKLGICRLSERCAEIEGTRAMSLSAIWGWKKVRLLRSTERVKSRYGVATVTRYRLA